MKKLDTAEIVKKLSGPIEPLGDSGIDRDRLENLNELGETVHELIQQIYCVYSDHKHSHEGSVIEASRKAKSILRNLADYVNAAGE